MELVSSQYQKCFKLVTDLIKSIFLAIYKLCVQYAVFGGKNIKFNLSFMYVGFLYYRTTQLVAPLAKKLSAFYGISRFYLRLLNILPLHPTEYSTYPQTILL